ncbi:phosphoserine phosphatase [Faunimonas pinastri]|uniref:Phosphoserine phosphatase n=1 Tax=Faunimonas pinastri TaxID=1855383 RepID=A0A1H9FLT4_9HYPH|nr:phosphoserine phosphatase SerB [Faunimonas pinastri]SEQ38882.1 phosphoserine phosphatase [Faunimonas pinastri]
MANVLNLIANPARSPIGDAAAEQARRAVEDAGGAPAGADWLSPGEALDLPFSGDPAAVLSAARAAFRDIPVDVNVVAVEKRRKRLLLADMDSTLIEQECIDELAAEIGVGERVAAITERAMRGEIEFEPALRERVALLEGLATAVTDKVLAERIRVTQGAPAAVATMRRHGAYAALVSGGFTVFAGPIAMRLGFDEFRANQLIVSGETFAGRVNEPILGREAKVEALRDLVARHGLDLSETLAVGDGANDLGMIKLAGLGVAYRAKPAVRAEAAAAIEHGDLTGLLFLQGYRREEFAEG